MVCSGGGAVLRSLQCAPSLMPASIVLMAPKSLLLLAATHIYTVTVATMAARRFQDCPEAMLQATTGSQQLSTGWPPARNLRLQASA